MHDIFDYLSTAANKLSWYSLMPTAKYSLDLLLFEEKNEKFLLDVNTNLNKNQKNCFFFFSLRSEEIRIIDAI